MDNKEFLNYLVISGKLEKKDLDKDKEERIIKCKTYIGDKVLRLLKDKIELEDSLELVDLSILSLGDKCENFLNGVCDLISNYRKVIYHDASEYMHNIVDSIYYGVEDEISRLASYKIILNPKFVNIENQVYRVESRYDSYMCLDYDNGTSDPSQGVKFYKSVLHLTNLKVPSDELKLGGILYKNGKETLVYDKEHHSSDVDILNLVKENKDLDFLVMGSLSDDRNSTLSVNYYRILEVLCDE